MHEGLLAAAAYVVSNTVDALAEAAQRCPGWPLVVAGETSFTVVGWFAVGVSAGSPLNLGCAPGGVARVVNHVL